MAIVKITNKQVTRRVTKTESIPINSWFLGGLNSDTLYVKTFNGLIVCINSLIDFSSCKEVMNYQPIEELDITIY